ncbi:hypothetical protein BJ878DRAFT_517041 [Calycina marina]|uniref:Uncharacterized protein n=1 Tax=Calycina marina TaxID=1763456 RepID=A0A9P7YYM1_9HELO|nr:hypothetical protein BJ878DRAFT_517041 [Calycina marina]
MYTVRPSPGKGFGVFALHDPEVGDIVLREPPMITIKPSDFVKESGHPTDAINQLARAELEQLSPKDQGDVASLSFHAISAEKENIDMLDIIFRSNAYKFRRKNGTLPEKCAHQTLQ